MNIKIIGLGGVGSNLAPSLCRYLASKRNPNISVTLIDGDRFEVRNADRQQFADVGNKAEITAQSIAALHPDIGVEAKPMFISDANAFFLIEENDIVLSAVDNHATRKLISDRCLELASCVLISGGNELYDGNVQVFVRQRGTNLTLPITGLHPEIAYPADKNPAELSCEELAALPSGGQILFTNLMVATLMQNAFWMVENFLQGEGKLVYSEQYFDLKSGSVRSVLREQKK